MKNSLDAVKHRLAEQKSLLKNKYKIIRLGIFGSYIRGEQQSGSDVDVLIDYDKAPSLIELIEIENMLSDLLGLKVDLVTSKGLKPQLRQRILDEVVYL
ncbi:MAG: DNA polymerase beta [Candidatus Electrothrix sp. AW5]|nr:DNA polymerase beta [Candidatus Electrothrix sp. AX1]MCI5129246.1 DNA polymerase beta [Candidatus Electrothrix gigas]MCI5181448.1 DNA polymerase beta [Candidatus Electrothrix gigas]MCI5194770.1 DNA polymerase beta [Candidatus Electrothrix gigas]